MNGQLYVIPELTTTFQQWRNLDTSFIAKNIMPEVPVDNEMFYVWSAGKEHLTIPTSTARMGRARAPESTYSRNTTLMGPLTEHALSDFITERQYKLGGSSLSVETQVVESLASQMELVDENSVATVMADTSKITHNTTLSGTNQWSDKANSNPFTDITTAVTTQANYSPMPANTAWMSLDVWLQICNHPDFLARLGMTTDRSMSEQHFLNLMAPYGITKLFIGRASYNTAAEGQTASLARVWGKHFWIGYVTDTPGQQEINGGYKFSLRGERKVTREQKVNPNGSEIVNIDFYDYEILSTDVYYLIKNAVA